jgi:hypothetical protein
MKINYPCGKGLNVFSVQLLKTSLVILTLLSFFTPRAESRPLEEQQVDLISNLYAIVGTTDRLADGNMVIFDNQYSNGVDGFDVRKFSNFGENLGLRRNGVLLALEKRALPAGYDTLFFDISNLNTINYRLEIVGRNLYVPGRVGVLQDLFLNRETLLSLDDTTRYQFAITSNPASSARNRFRVVLLQGSGSPLPVRFSLFNGFHDGERSRLSWQVQHLEDLQAFEVERSIDGRTFSVVSQPILPQYGSSTLYEWTDPSTEKVTAFYRIKSISTGGVFKYSTIVTISHSNKQERRIWMPNPVSSSGFSVQLVNQPRGVFTYRLVNLSGTPIATGVLRNQGGTCSFQLHPDRIPARGIHWLHLTAPDGQATVLRLLVVY